MSAEANTIGEWSETLPATAEIQEIAEQVKPELEEKTKKMYSVYNAVSYRSKVLFGGTHYLIKVSVSNTSDECVHLLVVQVLLRGGLEISLSKYQIDKRKEDPLEQF